MLVRRWCQKRVPRARCPMDDLRCVFLSLRSSFTAGQTCAGRFVHCVSLIHSLTLALRAAGAWDAVTSRTLCSFQHHLEVSLFDCHADILAWIAIIEAFEGEGRYQELHRELDVHWSITTFLVMDVPAHIIGAVTTTPPASPRRTQSTTHSRRQSFTYPQYTTYRDSNSSAEDVSTTSDSEHDHDYTTDLTTPASSESCTEDMQPDDVEDFRDREYPQLKGKTYLDHGGTTVCIGDGVHR